jgi:enoyl-CoA hydratase/carnithine racemase
MPAHYRTDEQDGVLTLTFTRPDKLNAITPEMTQGLWEAVEGLADDDAVHALVITGEGRFFTAGIDLTAPMPADAPDHREFRRRYARHHALYDAMEAVEKPVIIAMQGPCLGAGLEMAGSVDFRFATPETYVQLPEVALGTIAGSGGTSRLTRLVGPHWAKWIAMANQRVSAERALMMGLIHEVWPAEEFAERVQAFAVGLGTLPSQALGAAKLAVDAVTDVDRRTARDIERAINTALLYGPEYAEAKARFTSAHGGTRS